MTERVWGVYFSPCGNVRRVIDAMARAAGESLGAPVEMLDITRPRSRRQEYAFRPGDLVLLGTPVYAGRVPNKLMPFLRDQVRGSGAAGVAVVCFGNRSFDNALAELAALMRQNGFSVTGAAAVVTSHAFTDKLAPGQPDEAALDRAADFARTVAARPAGAALDPAAIPGTPDAPYYRPLGLDGQPADFLRATPDVDYSLCNHCGSCAAACPMGSIDRDDPGKTVGVCIKCQACVQVCRRHARSFSDRAFLSHVAMLERDFQRPASSLYIL